MIDEAARGSVRDGSDTGQESVRTVRAAGHYGRDTSIRACSEA